MNPTVRLLMLLGSLICEACVTTHRVSKDPVSIPIVYQPLFRACAPVDHEATVSVFAQGHREFTSLMVWNFPKESMATIQFNSHVGDTIFQLENTAGQWVSTGQISLDIKETKDGILSINGHRLPLLSSEVGCVLSGGWPSEWLNFTTIKDRKSNLITLSGGDRLRDIHVEAFLQKSEENFRSSDIKSCAVIKWGGFLGLFRNTAQVCRELVDNKVSMKISGIKSYVVEWVIANDS